MVILKLISILGREVWNASQYWYASHEKYLIGILIIHLEQMAPFQNGHSETLLEKSNATPFHKAYFKAL